MPLSASGDITSPEVETDASGNAVLAWLRSRRSPGAPRRLEVSARARGGRYARTQQLWGASDVEEFDLSVGPDGTAVVVWKARDLTLASSHLVARWPGGARRVAIRPPGPRSLFSPARELPRADGSAEARFLPDGTLVLAWVEAGRPVQVATRPPGGSLVVRHSIGANAAQLDIAVDRAGHVALVWAGLGGAFAAVRSPSGTLSGPIQLSAPGHGASLPRVGTNAAGESTAMWVERTGASAPPARQLMSSARPAAGSFGPRRVVADLVSSRFMPDLTLATSPTGESLALWGEDTGTPASGLYTQRISAAVREPGGSFGAPATLLDTEPRTDLRPPTVLFDRAGNATAVLRVERLYDLYREPGSSYAVTRRARAPFGPARRLGSGGQHAEAAMSAAGEVVALWSNAFYGRFGERRDFRVLSAVSAGGANLGAARLVEAGAAPAIGAGADLAAWTRSGGVRVASRDPRSGAFCAQTASSYVSSPFTDAGQPAAVAGDREGNALALFGGRSGARAVFGAAAPSRPRIRRFSVRPGQPRRGSRHRRRGATMRFRLSEAATVRVAVARRVRGRLRRAGTLVRSAPGGQNTLAVTGFRRRPLRRGSYRATITATDCDGLRSRSRHSQFVVGPAR